MEKKNSCLQSALHESYSCARIESALLAVCRRLHCWSNLIPKTQFLENRTKNWDAECTHSLIHPFHVNYLSLCVHCACAYCRVSTVDQRWIRYKCLLRLLFWIILFFIASHFVTCEIFCNFERRWCYNCAPAQTHDLRSHSEFNKLFLSAVCVCVCFSSLSYLALNVCVMSVWN